MLGLLALGGCREPASAGGWLGAGPTDAAAVNDASTPAPRASAAIAGFDLAPAVGDYWEYEISEGRPYALVTTAQRLTLTRATTITAGGGSVRVFDGEWRVIEGEGMARSPVQLAFWNHRILLRDPGGEPSPQAGRLEGWPTGWGVNFDGWNGAWPSGAGLFGGLPDGVLTEARSAQWEGRDAWEALVIGSANCQYVPGYGQLCGDDDPNRVFNTSEFFVAGIGLAGHTFIGCGSNGCYERRVRLRAWRVGGSPVTPPVDAGAPSSEDTDSACRDGRDNDNDGYIDCMDFNCSRNPAVTVCPTDAGVRDVPAVRMPEDTNAACSDGRDNDLDGYTDCMDFNCSRNPAVTVCRN